MRKVLITTALHILIWMVIIATITSMSLHPDNTFSIERNFPFIISYLFLVCFFYLNSNYLFDKFIPDRKYLLYLLIIGVILLLYIIFHNYIFSFFFQSDFSRRPPFPPERTHDPPFFPERRRMFSARRIILPLTQFFLFWLLSLSYRLLFEWVTLNKKNKEIEAEKSMIELAYLKAQINPHFILNTVNTIYSLILKKSDKAVDAILLYSRVIRYIFDKIDTEFVPLQEEIDYINNYIDLQIMRYTDSLHVEFEVEGDIENKQIAPLIFISFIENSFKYGISNHYPSTISIRIKAEDASVHFSAKNRKYKENVFLYKGRSIGVENTKKKLKLIYPDKHKLMIKETDDFFNVDLIISETLIETEYKKKENDEKD